MTTQAGDLPSIPITLPQNVWQVVEDRLGYDLTEDPDNVDLIRAWWAIRGDEPADSTHVEYENGTCSDGCVALHPDHASTRGED